MNQPDASLERTLKNGRERSFPTYQDLANYLIGRGAIVDEDELLSEAREKLPAIFFQWVRSGQLACHFAVNLAEIAVEDPSDLCWLPLVMTPPIDEEMVCEVQDFLEEVHRDAEAVLLVFTNVNTPDDIVRLVNSLCEHPSWSWTERECENHEDPAFFPLGLEWSLPDSELRNWVLGFTPYQGTPFTRYIKGAPFSVLAMRTLDISSNAFFPVKEEEKAVHLASMPLRLRCPVHRSKEKFDQITAKNKKSLLSGSLTWCARARVTFCLPNRCRSHLIGNDA